MSCITPEKRRKHHLVTQKQEDIFRSLFQSNTQYLKYTLLFYNKLQSNAIKYPHSEKYKYILQESLAFCNFNYHMIELGQ